MRSRRAEEQVRSYYKALARAYGAQNWWPAKSRFEVVAGAYLTQNTSWNNVERALERLRNEKKLNVRAVHWIRLKKLEQLVRPAGYFRQKAQRLKSFAAHAIKEYEGSLKRMLADIPASEVHKLRAELLQLPGVGKETADAILLYAGNQEVFVVDSYTRRIFSRHDLIDEEADYEEIRSLAERALASGRFAPVRSRNSGHRPSAMSMMLRSARAQRFNEMHGLLVKAGKLHCFREKPECKGCPLERFLPRKLNRNDGFSDAAQG